jgi:hypothetical protein
MSGSRSGQWDGHVRGNWCSSRGWSREVEESSVGNTETERVVI